MENVAAITFHESLLTIDEKKASLDTRQEVASDLAHEMAHMWFGDLVTMEWWDDLWLNEGFASWMAWKPVEASNPGWRLEQQEILETTHALSVDSIQPVREIRAKAETPAEINALFDGVAYGKAASVLRMVESYVGPETFREGANAYLEKHAYGNASADDFWNQLKETSGKPVDKIMASFTEQPGAPLIRVRTSCNGDKTEVNLAQERYFIDAAALKSGTNQLWSVPVNLREAGSNETTYELLEKRQQTFELAGCVPWVYANAGGKGYYRSYYDSGTLLKIGDRLETAFSPEERMRYLEDLWAMVHVGETDLGDYLSTLERMKQERSRAVMDLMIGRLEALHDFIVEPAERPALEAWTRRFLGPMLDDLGEEPKAGESDEQRALRSEVFAALATYGREPRLLAKSRAIVDAYMESPDSVDAGSAASALTTCAENGDAALYEEYVSHMKTAKTPTEHDTYLNALGAFGDPALAKRTFELVLGPEVKSQDVWAISGPLQNYATQEAAWELFKSDFPAILKKTSGPNQMYLAQFAGVFCDARQGDDAQKFFAEQKLPGTERILRNAKDYVNSCIELRTLQRRNLSAFLEGQAVH